MKITRLLSSRFWSASLPELSRISTFRGCLVTPARAGSAKSSVFPSGDPSTGQNTPQNFCLGLGGLWRKGGAAPAVDMLFQLGAEQEVTKGRRVRGVGPPQRGCTELTDPPTPPSSTQPSSHPTSRGRGVFPGLPE